ncbi:hypothetical protein ABID82_005087 [Methylobacterium sp. PvP062]|uniref:Uncharacterized protein n=1 Tax=Methylobacterium radiotolerans TaxID=31998 RepID=A0ABV2NU75_9HYPH|nr:MULTISPECIES: hypothetical protein [unclassified Methylobacterium]MBP2498401.1 hypothetical protein [Methylobacterium sp. PvP105]MBP2505580.1 hypothetical protein [Methylobacterium sp. PvP109]
MSIPKKKAPRPNTPQQNLEAGVGAVTRSITALVKLIERSGEKLTAEDVVKAFSFIGVANAAGQTKALAAVQAASLTSFSLDRAIPAIGGVQLATAPAPVVPGAPIGASPAPARPAGRPSVDELGGRFCRDVRDAAKRTPGNDRGLIVSGSGGSEDVGFVDDDEASETEEE